MTDNVESAPEHMQLAVDLIYLLESNEIDEQVALQALKIVQMDLESKLASKEKS